MTERTKGHVRHAFEQETRVVAISKLLPLKQLRPGVKDSKKYQQILCSVRTIGLVEAPVIIPDPAASGSYFLLDGHLRVEALKDIGAETVECLLSTEDEGYTYNKQINRLAAIQEHRMICRAIARGVPEAKIALALGLEVVSVQRRSRMLNGICPEAIEILKDLPCPIILFDMLRQMRPARQLEAAELMVGQNNVTGQFAKALLAATPDQQLVKPRAKSAAGGASIEHLARMERELARLQVQVKSVEDSYGVDNLHLTVARGYVRSLLGNARLVRWISQHRPEYLAELQAIAEVESLSLVPVAAE